MRVSAYPLIFTVIITSIFFEITFAQTTAPKPNILLILTDDQGYYDVGACGAKDLLTPNIDKLFSQGMQFTNFYANSSVCSPTRASINTGLYPDRAGVPGVIRTQKQNSWGYLNPDVVTLADQLKSAGYHTALIGKWHLGLEKPNIPTMRGYEFFKGFLGDMMDDYYTHTRHGNNYMRENEKEIQPQGHATDLFSKWAVEFIKAQAESKKPFFLQLAYNAPHDPIQPPAEWLEKVKIRQPGISDKRAKLVALIEHLDSGIGTVLQALEESGQLENTLIIFTSDNGGKLQDGANNGPLRDGKQSMYEGGLRVPTCIRWQGHIEPGSSTLYKAMSMDLYPTLLEAAGITNQQHVDGISILPVLRGQQMDDTKRVYYFVRREGGTEYGGLTIQAIQLGNWKLLQNTPFGVQELYNLEEDPFESIDLIESEPVKYAELNRLLMKYIQNGGKSSWQRPD
ncbi:MAG: sulfatase-like hydrolase/transferase [Cyclobacteriaceae bacterium]|nr:sulfatase-like hydrolase/transferase [Cyclobacteriaceae bacterium]